MYLLHMRTQGNQLPNSLSMLRDNLAYKCQDLHLAHPQVPLLEDLELKIAG